MLSTVYMIKINFLYLLGHPFTFALFLVFPNLLCLCIWMGIIFLPIYPCFSFLLTSAVLDLRHKALCNRSGGVLMCFSVAFSPACPHAFTS